jgi:hypothetical protein
MRRITLALTLLAPLFVFAPAPSARADEIGSAMADAASRFLGVLDDAQRSQAAFAFDSPERFNWHWIPRPRKGLPIKSLKPEQRALAFGLLDTGLSTKGMIRATTIMSFEEILRVEEHGTGPVRDPELYYVSIFGTPSDGGEWGWRVEGHHLALNFTVRDGKVVSATPFMFGSNPAKVKSGSSKGLRNLAEIQEPAYALAASLTDEQRKAAVVSQVVPEVTVTPNSATPKLDAPRGISSDALSSEQRLLLTKLIKAYYANFPESIRDEMTARLGDGQKGYHFAWFGPIDPEKPHAFHVQGPALFIDFNDEQNQANHIHTFYRSTVGDFGLPASN